MKRIYRKKFKDGSIWEIYLDEEKGIIYSYEGSASREQVLAVYLVRGLEVQEVYYKDALVESGQCPDFG